MTIYYTEEHEYLKVSDDVAVIGITDYAQSQLGDIVYIELPAVGATVSQGDELAVAESVKAAAEVYAPIDGEVLETNSALEGESSLLNTDPEGEGWVAKVRIGDASQLKGFMDKAAYDAFVKGI